MDNTTYQTTPNRFITARGARFAYRVIGDASKPPLLLLTHLAATMDDWDPAVLNQLREHYQVIVFDNKGVGLTTGTVQSTIEGMAQGVLTFMDAMRLTRVHLLGLSMGGMIAQELVKIAPERVEKLILVGTGPKGGTGIAHIRPTTHLFTMKALIHGKNPKFYLFFNLV
ncbi:alpha/beta hydrolase [Staphylococcus microti]|uniref:Alpha/beta hydrolase n=1 Tax=Staphylococcus microti TaxID=569857 RepID=A0A380GS79_9STAP|nr:alpha/beta hydrolase [Staphylococcus microti]SUM56397.1 alpha/beta hydrolase [Staphylococcus microti]